MARAFTLVEMMVVLTISLMLMTMIVPIFKVSTKTVQVIERKLAVYEAARNLLDVVESDIQLAVTNERGGHFSLKRVSWTDTDTFTPVSATPALIPGVTDAASLAYKQSRRFSDALNYVRLDGGGTGGIGPAGPSQFTGGKPFPLSYPAGKLYYPECWRASLRSTLLYQHQVSAGDYETAMSAPGDRWTRNEQLADVSQIELAFIFLSMGDQFTGSGGSVTQHWDPVPDILGPGKEVRTPNGYTGNFGNMRQRRLGQMKVMDLALSYWDDTVKQFKELPDNTVVYFWPPPKCVRATVTVCDIEKRQTVTLCRIMQIPIGLGAGGVNDAALDTAYYTPAPGNTTPAIYNRTKYMPSLPAAFNGDQSWPGASDWSKNSETKTILRDGVKPYQWP